MDTSLKSVENLRSVVSERLPLDAFGPSRKGPRRRDARCTEGRRALVRIGSSGSQDDRSEGTLAVSRAGGGGGGGGGVGGVEGVDCGRGNRDALLGRLRKNHRINESRCSTVRGQCASCGERPRQNSSRDPDQRTGGGPRERKSPKPRDESVTAGRWTPLGRSLATGRPAHNCNTSLGLFGYCRHRRRRPGPELIQLRHWARLGDGPVSVESPRRLKGEPPRQIRAGAPPRGRRSTPRRRSSSPTSPATPCNTAPRANLQRRPRRADQAGAQRPRDTKGCGREHQRDRGGDDDPPRDGRLDRARAASRRPGRPRRDGRLRRATGVPARPYARTRVSAAASTASSTTSSELSRKAARSGPGDLDLVAYSLRKYVRLALKGHPTILLLLFVPDELLLVETELGRRLKALRPALLSRRAGRGYLGYLRGQKERLLGTRGQRNVNRPGARRGARLRHEVRDARSPARLPGHRAAADGPAHAPDARARAVEVMAIRTGERSFEEAIAEIDEVDRLLAEALEASPLRPTRTGRQSTGFWSMPTGSAWGW